MTKSTRRRSESKGKLKPHVLKNEADYEAALAWVETLMDAQKGNARGEELELWAWLIEAYENERHPIAPPTPLETIRFRMEQQGLEAKDLVSNDRQSQQGVGSIERETIAVRMIRALHEKLGIPAESLIGAAA